MDGPGAVFILRWSAPASPAAPPPPTGGRADGPAVGHQLEPLGLQPAGPEDAHHIRQPFRPVAQGKPPPIPHQSGGGGAQLLQGTVFLAPSGTAAPSTAQGKIGWVGHHQVKGPGRQRHGTAGQRAGSPPPDRCAPDWLRAVPGGQGVQPPPR